MNNNLLKNRFTRPATVGLLLLVTGCSVFRPGTTAAPDNGSAGRASPAKTNQGDGRFINAISTDNASDEPLPGPEPKVSRNAVARNDGNRPGNTVPLYRTKDNSSGSSAPLSVLQLKYSMLTNTPVEKLDNQKLLEFMDQWYGVPYHFGGTTKRGIDCSAFTLTLMESVYGLNSLPRISRDQYAAAAKISRKKLREGDLVFFHTYGKGRTVTHVGVYLYNNRFIHASVSGVQIDDLDGSYYSRHFIGAGRVLD